VESAAESSNGYIVDGKQTVIGLALSCQDGTILIEIEEGSPWIPGMGGCCDGGIARGG
jgi:hypothetical protein